MGFAASFYQLFNEFLIYRAQFFRIMPTHIEPLRDPSRIQSLRTVWSLRLDKMHWTNFALKYPSQLSSLTALFLGARCFGVEKIEKNEGKKMSHDLTMLSPSGFAQAVLHVPWHGPYVLHVRFWAV